MSCIAVLDLLVSSASSLPYSPDGPAALLVKAASGDRRGAEGMVFPPMASCWAQQSPGRRSCRRGPDPDRVAMAAALAIRRWMRSDTASSMAAPAMRGQC